MNKYFKFAFSSKRHAQAVAFDLELHGVAAAQLQTAVAFYVTADNYNTAINTVVSNNGRCQSETITQHDKDAVQAALSAQLVAEQDALDYDLYDHGCFDVDGGDYGYIHC